LKDGSELAEVTKGGRLFHTREAATFTFTFTFNVCLDLDKCMSCRVASSGMRRWALPVITSHPS